jgi:hypothetical protein
MHPKKYCSARCSQRRFVRLRHEIISKQRQKNIILNSVVKRCLLCGNEFSCPVFYKHTRGQKLGCSKTCSRKITNNISYIRRTLAN